MYKSFATALSLATLAYAQQIGTNTKEEHLDLSWETCDKITGCSDVMGKVVLDANWRWVHNTGGYQNCYTGNTWDQHFCPDDKSCAANCALDGVDSTTWRNTYGVQGGNDSLKLGFVTQGPYSKNIGSRTFLMADDNNYQ